MLTVTMLVDWGPPEYIWLKKGETVSLPRAFATLLIKQKKARFDGSALEMFATQ